MKYTVLVKEQTNQSDLGRYMAEWRAQQNLSMRAAAEQAQISHSTWADIENNKRPADTGTFVALSRVLERSIDDLVEMEGRHRPYRRSKAPGERAARITRTILDRPRLEALFDQSGDLQDQEIDLILSLAESLRKRRRG